MVELDSPNLSIALDDPVYARIVADGDLRSLGAVSNRPGSGLIEVRGAVFVGTAIELEGKFCALVKFPSYNQIYRSGDMAILPYRSPIS